MTELKSKVSGTVNPTPNSSWFSICSLCLSCNKLSKGLFFKNTHQPRHVTTSDRDTSGVVLLVLRWTLLRILHVNTPIFVLTPFLVEFCND